MNPLADIRTNLNKEFQQEQIEFNKFNTTLDPILKKLKSDPANQQGFFTRFIYSPSPETQSLMDAIAKLELMEQYEVRLTQLQKEIDAFKPEDGPLELVQLSRRFESILASILECRIQVVANILRCDDSAKRVLNTLRNEYKYEIAEIRYKLDELDKLYREVNEDVSGKFAFRSEEPTEKIPNKIEVLHKHLHDKFGLDLKQALKKPFAEIAKINAKIRDAKSFKEMEILKLDMKVAQQEYDKVVVNFINPKRGDAVVKNAIDEIEVEMAARGKEIRAAGRTTGTWETKQWGLLLMSSDKEEISVKPKSTGAKLSDAVVKLKEAGAKFIGQGFTETMNKLKKRKHEIKRELAKLDKKEAKYLELEYELQEINRTLYHCILTRSIDVIAEKEWQIRNDKLDPVQKSVLQYDLLKLNTKFQSTLAKYSVLSKRTRSLNQALTEEAKNVFLNAISCGFYNGKLDSVDELISKKQYADVGYSMMNYLPKFLEETQIPADMSASSYILSQIKEFVEWAEKHPDKASMMAGDMALTLMLITQNTNAVGNLHTQLAVRSYAIAFIAPIGNPTWEEMDRDKELKYRALADFSRYAPPMAAVGRNVVQHLFSGNVSPTGLLQAAWVAGASTNFVQRINELVKTDYLEVAKAVSGILAGDDIRGVFATQQNIELVRMAGISRNATAHPIRFVDTAMRNLKIWWRTMNKAPLLEILARATGQIVIPAAIAAFGLSMIGVAILGGPAVWFTAVAWAMASFLLSGTALWRFSSFFNTVFADTYQKFYDEVTAAQRDKIRAAFKAKEGDKIRRMREDYIIELEANRQIPIIEPPKNLTLNPVETKAAYAIANHMKQNILAKLAPLKNDQTGFLTETYKLETLNPVDSLNTHFKLAEALKEAEKFISEDSDLKNLRPAEQKNLAGFLCSRITDELITEWLNPRLEEVWIEQAVDAIIAQTEIGDIDPAFKDKTEPEIMEILESRKKKIIEDELVERKVRVGNLDEALDEAGKAVTTKRQTLRRRRRNREPLEGPDF